MEIEEQEIALQHAVYKICTIIAEKTDVTFSDEFINSLTALAFQSIGDISQKLTYFAKHAKRSVITNDDIKLYFRCSQQMLPVIERSRDAARRSDKKAIKCVVEKTFTSQNHLIGNSLIVKDKNSDPVKPQTSQRESRHNVKKKNVKEKHYVAEYKDEDVNSEDQQVRRNGHKQDANKENGNIQDITKNATKLKGKLETQKSAIPRRTRQSSSYEERSLRSSKNVVKSGKSHPENTEFKRSLAQSERSLQFPRNAKQSVNYQESSFIPHKYSS